MQGQERRLSYAEWATVLFKKFSKEMGYIKKNTNDHERAQMSRANARGTPDDKMALREIYDEMWELDARCNKGETIGTVSYTHLDVYKRQDLRAAKLFLILLCY